MKLSREEKILRFFDIIFLAKKKKDPELRSPITFKPERKKKNLF